MRSQQLLRVICACSILGLVGCQGDGDAAAAADPLEWGTKDRSVLGNAPALPRLNAPAAFVDQASVEEYREAAIGLLTQAADSTNPLLRANAIEALHGAPDRLEPVVRLGLGDENRGVRFAAVMTVGKHRMESLAHLVEPLLSDKSESVQAAAIYALRECSRPVDLTPLAGMVMSPDPEVKANAALVLGELGDRSAVPLLKEAARMRSTRIPVERARIVELQIAEALAQLGEEEELHVIRAALFTPDEQGELAVLACQLCGRLRDQAYLGALRDMALRTGRGEEPPELRLAAAQATMMIDPSTAPTLAVVPMLYLDSDRYDLRAQAAVTLGYLGDPKVLPNLAAMMQDRNALVQVAAAGAILRSLPR